MDISTLYSTKSPTSTLSPSFLTPATTKHHSSFSLSAKLSPDSSSSDLPPNLSTNIRRPQTLKKSSPATPPPPNPNPNSPNPLRNLLNPSKTQKNPDNNLGNKLWLTSRISPPPPPPPSHPLPPSPPLTPPLQALQKLESDSKDSKDFRQEGKIFVGNLPLWIKKNEVAEFFRQFGPIKNVILIKGHETPERNLGYGFVIYGGPIAGNSASKAVEFDGVEFHGRVLTVKFDDGRKLKEREEERGRWVSGEDGREYRSHWHEDRENSRREFKRVVESQPENWQAVVRAFERIKKEHELTSVPTVSRYSSTSVLRRIGDSVRKVAKDWAMNQKPEEILLICNYTENLHRFAIMQRLCEIVQDYSSFTLCFKE